MKSIKQQFVEQLCDASVSCVRPNCDKRDNRGVSAERAHPNSSRRRTSKTKPLTVFYRRNPYWRRGSGRKSEMPGQVLRCVEQTGTGPSRRQDFAGAVCVRDRIHSDNLNTHATISASKATGSPPRLSRYVTMGIF